MGGDPDTSTVSERVVEVESYASGVLLINGGLSAGELVVIIFDHHDQSEHPAYGSASNGGQTIGKRREHRLGLSRSWACWH